MAEREITNALLLRLSKTGARLFRNNTGMAWAGEKLQGPTGAARLVTLKNARPLHAGLCKGSSDLIGWTPVEITESMVGKKLAVFTALEVKSPRGRTSEEQERFINEVTRAGGIGRVVRKPEDADECGYFLL